MGSANGLENDLILATNTSFDAYDTVMAGPLHGVNPLRAILSVGQLTLGTLKAIRIFARQRPAAVFLTGGWVGLPVALAATLFRVPIVIYVPDIEPGLTLKVLGRFARIITASTADTQPFFPNKRLIETGYPLRPDLMASTRDAGIARFGLDPALKTLLIWGGSRGARSINRATLAMIEKLLQASNLQIIHVSGSLDWAEVQAAHQALSPNLQSRYHIFEYLHDLGLAMAAADLVVSRAGASILGEYPYFELPSILVPYPHAWRYQKVNADWLVSRGAGQRLDDEKLHDELLPTVQALLQNPDQLTALQDAAKKLARGDGAENIVRVLLKLE